MSNACAQNMNSLSSKEDLFKLFYDWVDQNVIEVILDNRYNDLTMAYYDLLEITNSSDLGLEHLHLSSSNDDENQPAVTNSDTTNFIDRNRLSNYKNPIDKITYLISKNCKVMVLMRGCPGSGKSFQAINILNLCYQNAVADEFIFSADKYFTDKHTGKYNFEYSKLSSAHAWTYKHAQEAVNYNVTPVIIDNTNVQCWEMKNYVELAVLNGYWIEVIEPVSEWAWDPNILVKNTKHSVSHDKICLMIQRYDHITYEELFTRFDLKYSINNMPPKLSNSPRKYKLAENLLDERKVVNTLNRGLNEMNDLSVNDQFKNCISQNHGNTKNNQCTSSNYNENHGIESLIQGKESHVVSELKNSSYSILNVDEENQFTSSDEGASMYVNKSVNTYENELLFMISLNQIPREKHSSNVHLGKSRDINEKNQKQNVCKLSIGKSNKGTSTDDLTTTIHQPKLTDKKKTFKTIGENVKNKFALDDSLGSQVKKNENILDRDNIISDSIRENLITIKDDEQKFVQLVVETSVLDQLCNYFHDCNPDLNKNTLMTAQISEKLAEDLYCCLITNVSPQICNEKTIMQDRDNIISDSIGENLISVKDDEQKFVQLVVETSILDQLCNYFHDCYPDLGKNTLMTAQISEKLAEDLYCCLITNVSPHDFNQKIIMQDEILARKLQEENAQKEYPCKGSNHFSGKISFAEALSKPKLSQIYKNVIPKRNMDINRNTDFKFQIMNGVVNPNSPINQDSPNIVGKKKDNINEVKSNKPNNQNYEQQAKHENVAEYKYLEEIFKTKMDLKKIDLHNLLVHEAIHILDLFLDNHILILRKPNGGRCLREKINIITGRGRHSLNHRPRIRPAVLNRISQRNIENFDLRDAGVLMVIVKSTSLLTSEIH